MSLLPRPLPPARAYLGKGLAFPLAAGPNGRLARASGEAKVEQSIALILSTAPGERVMRQDLGCAIHDMVFAPNDPSNVVRITEAVRQIRGTSCNQVERVELSMVTGFGGAPHEPPPTVAYTAAILAQP